MTPAEAAALLGVAAQTDNRKASESAARMWAEILQDVRVEDARAAIVEHYGRSTEWVMPAHILEIVKTIRRRRVADMPPPQPPESIDPDDTATERAWIRAYTTAIGDGHDPVTADRVACATVNVTRPTIEASRRPVDCLVEQTAAAMPRIPRRDA